eukprot:PhM_4_TR13324/c0_g1_i1/m.72704
MSIENWTTPSEDGTRPALLADIPQSEVGGEGKPLFGTLVDLPSDLFPTSVSLPVVVDWAPLHRVLKDREAGKITFSSKVSRSTILNNDILFVSSVRIADFWTSIPVAPTSQKYATFAKDGRLLCFVRGPPGQVPTIRRCHQILEQVAAQLGTHLPSGCHVAPYMSDMVITGVDFEAMLHATAHVHKALKASLKVNIDAHNSILNPRGTVGAGQQVSSEHTTCLTLRPPKQTMPVSDQREFLLRGYYQRVMDRYLWGGGDLKGFLVSKDRAESQFLDVVELAVKKEWIAEQAFGKGSEPLVWDSDLIKKLEAPPPLNAPYTGLEQRTFFEALLGPIHC